MKVISDLLYGKNDVIPPTGSLSHVAQELPSHAAAEAGSPAESKEEQVVETHKASGKNCAERSTALEKLSENGAERQVLHQNGLPPSSGSVHQAPQESSTRSVQKGESQAQNCGKTGQNNRSQLSQRKQSQFTKKQRKALLQKGWSIAGEAVKKRPPIIQKVSRNTQADDSAAPRKPLESKEKSQGLVRIDGPGKNTASTTESSDASEVSVIMSCSSSPVSSSHTTSPERVSQESHVLLEADKLLPADKALDTLGLARIEYARDVRAYKEALSKVDALRQRMIDSENFVRESEAECQKYKFFSGGALDRSHAHSVLEKQISSQSINPYL